MWGNNKGMSLMEVMIAMGLASTLSLMVSSMLIQMQKMQFTQDAQNESHNLEEESNQILSNDQECTDSLKGQSIKASLKMTDPTYKHLVVLGAGKIYKKFWTIKEVKLVNVVSVENVAHLKTGHLEITFEKIANNTFVPKIWKQKLKKIYFRTAMQGELEIIDACFGNYSAQMNAKTTCRLLGGNWIEDESVELNERCNLRDLIKERVAIHLDHKLKDSRIAEK